MRSFIRLVVVLALVLGAAAFSPLAVASPETTTPEPTATTPSATSSTEPTEPRTEPKAEPEEESSPAQGRSATTDDQRAQRNPAQPVATIVKAPTNPSVAKTTTFTFRADRPGAKFVCRLDRPGRAGTFSPCGPDGVTAGNETYTKTYPTAASRSFYRFIVRPYIPVTNIQGVNDLHRWRVFTLWAPDRAVPRVGVTFNMARGSETARRANLIRVIRTINSMPGYKEAHPSLCPTAPSLWPGRIRISLYSLTDGRVGRVLAAAHRRCLSVRILQNQHLDRHNNPTWRYLENNLGRNRSLRSFAYRCSGGCRGSLLHTKMYLFDSKWASRSAFNNLVLTGSSNMTSNAAKFQYNDLYGDRNPALYKTFATMFDRMQTDRSDRVLRQYTDGRYQSTFWPRSRSSKQDPELAALRAVRCSGANGGAGINGRTVVYINMHAWFGTRGLAFANQVRRLYNAGCYTRILYGFMSYGVFKKLKSGTGSRMLVRRSLWSKNGETAYMYSHMKAINISGVVGSDRSAWVSYTGSNNFTDDGHNFDEVMLRIPGAGIYRAYVNRWWLINRRKSFSTYANYSEPRGGGRAPRMMVRDDDLGGAPISAPTIESDQVLVTPDGRMTVRD